MSHYLTVPANRQETPSVRKVSFEPGQSNRKWATCHVTLHLKDVHRRCAGHRWLAEMQNEPNEAPFPRTSSHHVRRQREPQRPAWSHSSGRCRRLAPEDQSEEQPGVRGPRRAGRRRRRRRRAGGAAEDVPLPQRPWSKQVRPSRRGLATTTRATLR